MDAGSFLVRRGDALALAAVAALGVWAVAQALGDASIRASAADARDIRARIDAIAEERARQEPPRLAAAADRHGELLARLQAALAVPPVMTDLTDHPDQQAGPLVDRHPYLYPLKPPVLAVADRIGVLELVVTPPPVAAYADERVSDAPRAAWVRGGQHGPIRNHAAIAGYLLEQRIGAATEWTRLAVLAPEAAAVPYQVPATTAGETYRFRARTLLRATGVEAGVDGADVVVLRGAPSEPVDWAAWSRRPLPAGSAELSSELPVADGERLYVSDPGAAMQTIASPDLKIALKGIQRGAAGAPDQAILLLSRLVRRQGKPSFWCPPQRFDVAIGGAVGAKGAKVLPPEGGPLKIPVDLATPFVLERIGEANRVLGYDLTFVPDGHGRRLDALEHAVQVDTVVLLDPATGARREIPRLSTVGRTARLHLVPWPDLPETKEEAAFVADPATFVPPTLAAPTAPTRHAPGDGPLQALKQAGDPLAATDHDYLELPDGRVVYWEPVNGVERVVPGPVPPVGEVRP